MSGEHTRLACWLRRLAETIFFFTEGNEGKEGANGISGIEGKAATGSGERAGEASECQIRGRLFFRTFVSISVHSSLDPSSLHRLVNAGTPLDGYFPISAA